jgi:nucleoside-diphosphate-sugar epimerase
MIILIIGGTGFIGTHLVRKLSESGHSVSVFHRGQTRAKLPARSILGERQDLARLGLKADVVVDLILSSGAQATALMNAFRGKAGRVVVASSMDVYRACGILHGSEEGPLEPVPLTENSALRSKLQTYPAEQLKMLQKIFGWLDGEYDKIPVEKAVLSDPELPGTVLRLPMIYGPGDHLCRFHPVLKRIGDGRRLMLCEEGWAQWRTPRGYVENVAAALALAAVSERAGGRMSQRRRRFPNLIGRARSRRQRVGMASSSPYRRNACRRTLCRPAIASSIGRLIRLAFVRNSDTKSRF